MPRVCLNLLYLDPGRTGGMEVVARALLPQLREALPSDWALTAVVNRRAADDATGPWHDLDGLQVIDVDVASRPRWVLAEQRAVGAAAARLRTDLLHSLGNLGPWKPGVPHLITVHDLIHHRAPPPGLSLASKITGALVVRGARRADRVAVVASQTARDLVEIAGVARERIDVIPNGITPPSSAAVPEAELRARLELGDRPLLLSPSARQPHKNLDRLLQAHALLPSPRPLLVLPGYATAQDAALQRRANALGIADDLRLLGWVDDDELEGLYAASRLLVFPSLYEGFGLPVLEAMQRGLPVACSTRGSLAEIAGDAALAFEPEDPQAIADAMARLLADQQLRNELIARGRRQAAPFTWQTCASGYVASYHRTLGLVRPPEPLTPEQLAR